MIPCKKQQPKMTDYFFLVIKDMFKSLSLYPSLLLSLASREERSVSLYREDLSLSLSLSLSHLSLSRSLSLSFSLSPSTPLTPCHAKKTARLPSIPLQALYTTHTHTHTHTHTPHTHTHTHTHTQSYNLHIFYAHFNKPLFQHHSSYPQAFHNLASSVSWHHVDKVWCELLVSSWRSMN